MWLVKATSFVEVQSANVGQSCGLPVILNTYQPPPRTTGKPLCAETFEMGVPALFNGNQKDGKGKNDG